VLASAAEPALRSAVMHLPDVKSMRDSILAATALQLSLTLVTRNVADVDGNKIKLINAWKDLSSLLHVQLLIHDFARQHLSMSCLAESQPGLNE
jgi:hypothetical protein